jgi:hypothetical protein
LDGYLVGTYNDVYKSLNIYLNQLSKVWSDLDVCFKVLKQNQSYVEKG